MEILLHMDGTDGTQTFTDSSTNVATVTAEGNAQIDTAFQKFGTASALFDGTGDYLTLPDSANYTVGAGDATWDCWIRPANAADTETIFCQGSNSLAYYHMQLAGGTITFSIYVAGASVLTITSTTNITNGTWFHVAVTKSGTTYRLFVNGALEDTDTYATAMADYTGVFAVGAKKRGTTAAADHYQGSVDEFRFLVGTAAWTAAFTPPTVAYKNPA